MSDTKITVEIYCESEDAIGLKLLVEDFLDRARCDTVFDKHITVEDEEYGA